MPLPLRRLSVAFAALCAFGVTPVVFARPADSKPAQPASAKAGAAAAAWIKPSAADPKLFDVDFPGGSLASYYAGIAPLAESQSLLPLVVSDRAEHVSLQALSIRGTSLWALYQMPVKLMPGVTLSAVDGASFSAPDGTTTVRGAYVVGVAPGITESAPPARPARFDLDFPGGNVGAYVETIRKVCPEANVVMLEGAEKMSVPAVKFRAVTVGAAMRAIERYEQGPNGMHSALIVRSIDVEGSSESVFKVELDTKPVGPNAAESVHVWSLAPSIAAGVKVEDALSAIDAALAVDQRPVTIKYHEATNLLIVRATEQQHKVIDDVIHEVEYTVQVKKEAKESK